MGYIIGVLPKNVSLPKVIAQLNSLDLDEKVTILRPENQEFLKNDALTSVVDETGNTSAQNGFDEGISGIWHTASTWNVQGVGPVIGVGENISALSAPMEESVNFAIRLNDRGVDPLRGSWYEDSLRRGNTVVMMKSEGENPEQLMDTLQHLGVEDLYSW